MTDISFSKFKIEYLDECVEAYMKTYSQEPWNERWESSDIVADLRKNHYNNNYFRGYVALKNGNIAGVSIGFLKPWISGMEYYIDDYFIHIDFHRQGIGKAFMAYIKEDLTRDNIHAIILNTERGYPSQLFYESVGFKPEGELLVLTAVF